MTSQIKILGRLHANHEKLFQKKSIFTTKGVNDAILVCDYSPYDVSIGHTFYEMLDVDKKTLAAGQITLREVSQNYLKRFDCIPKGHKTVCRFELEETMMSIVMQLPVIDGWDDKHSTSVYLR